MRFRLFATAPGYLEMAETHIYIRKGVLACTYTRVYITFSNDCMRMVLFPACLTLVTL